MIAFKTLFRRSESVVIGMVHLRALPGSPRQKFSLNEISEVACNEAYIYSKSGVDGIMIENMHDLPWQRPEELGPETVSSMAVVCAAVRREFPTLPIGVQVLSSGNRHALAIAKAAGLNFIRCEGFVFSHIGDEGPVVSCAADLIRYRKFLNADDVMIFTDVKKKHSSHALTSDISLVDTAKASEMFLSDGVVITGTATGLPAIPEDVNDVFKSVKIPTIVGSGVTTENVTKYLSANGMIVGSHLKMHGQWYNDLDPVQVRQFMSKVNKHRDIQEAELKQTAIESSMYGYSSADEPCQDDSDSDEEIRSKVKSFKPLISQGE